MYTILSLNKITSADNEWVGQKVSQLIPLLNIVHIPSGFVITKSVFETYLDEMDITAKIKASLQNINPDDTEKLTSIANEIQRMIVSREMPPELRMEILDYYHTLTMDQHIPISELLNSPEEPFVAVRSSPVEECVLEHIYMNLLNISGEDRLMKAIQSCWASLFTPHAIAHRLKNDITQTSMAVFVQRMIDAERSGVVYSTHPTNPEAILIHGCYGLGAVLASRTVLCDEYVLKRDTYDILEVKLQRQEFKLIKDMEQCRTVKVDLPDPHASHQKFNEKHMIIIGKIAKRIEKHFNKPQAIEFALCGEEMYVLGVHPMHIGESNLKITSQLPIEPSIEAISVSPTTANIVCPQCKITIPITWKQ